MRYQRPIKATPNKGSKGVGLPYQAGSLKAGPRPLPAKLKNTGPVVARPGSTRPGGDPLIETYANAILQGKLKGPHAARIPKAGDFVGAQKPAKKQTLAAKRAAAKAATIQKRQAAQKARLSAQKKAQAARALKRAKTLETARASRPSTPAQRARRLKRQAATKRRV
jgi:hypothetical protein